MASNILKTHAVPWFCFPPFLSFSFFFSSFLCLRSLFFFFFLFYIIYIKSAFGLFYFIILIFFRKRTMDINSWDQSSVVSLVFIRHFYNMYQYDGKWLRWNWFPSSIVEWKRFLLAFFFLFYNNFLLLLCSSNWKSSIKFCS